MKRRELSAYLIVKNCLFYTALHTGHVKACKGMISSTIYSGAEGWFQGHRSWKMLIAYT